jgi:hypothetical protein
MTREEDPINPVQITVTWSHQYLQKSWVEVCVRCDPSQHRQDPLEPAAEITPVDRSNAAGWAAARVAPSKCLDEEKLKAKLGKGGVNPRADKSMPTPSQIGGLMAMHRRQKKTVPQSKATAGGGGSRWFACFILPAPVF